MVTCLAQDDLAGPFRNHQDPERTFPLSGTGHLQHAHAGERSFERRLDSVMIIAASIHPTGVPGIQMDADTVVSGNQSRLVSWLHHQVVTRC